MKYLFNLHLTISIFLSSFVFLSYQNASQILFDSHEPHKITLTFKEQTDIEFIEKYISDLQKKFDFKDIVLHTPTDQFDEFIKSFSMYSQGTFESEEILKIIPYSCDIILNSNQNKEIIKKELLSQNFFIESGAVSTWVEKLNSFSNLINKIGHFLFLFLFSTTALVTAATVRVFIFQNFKQIQIRSYLGESFFSLALSDFKNTAFFYTLSMTIGISLNYLCFNILKYKFFNNLEFNFMSERIKFLNLNQILILISGFTCSFLIGSAYSYIKTYSQIYNED